jgi:hypothetical protein
VGRVDSLAGVEARFAILYEPIVSSRDKAFHITLRPEDRQFPDRNGSIPKAPWIRLRHGNKPRANVETRAILAIAITCFAMFVMTDLQDYGCR